MGFLDKLFRKSAPQEKTTKEKLRLPAHDTERKIREKMEAERKGFDKDFEHAARNIPTEAKQVGAAVERLSRKSISDKMPGYKIGLQVRDDYAKRIPQFLAELEKTGGEWREYGKRLSRANAEIMRITKDNRYLFHFFPDEMKEVGGAMKRLAESGKNFEEAVEKERKALEKYHAALDKIAFLKKAEKELAELESHSDALEKQAFTLQKQAGSAGEGDYSSREGALKEELEAAEKSFEAARQQIAQVVSPLQRLLRKYQKSCTDKELCALASKYSENPVEHALKDFAGGECPALKRLAGEVKQAIATGMLAVEARDEQKTLHALSEILEGKVDSLASSAKKFSEQSESAGASLEFLLNEKSSFDSLKKKAEEAEASHEKNKAAIASAREKITHAKREAGAAASEALDAEVIVE